MSPMRLLVIIPCFNEALGLADLLKSLQSAIPDVTAVVIDDGSSDETFQVATQFVRTIRLPINLGIGGAVQTGIKLAVLEDFDFCLQLDGDGQHPPAEIQKFIRSFQEEPCQLLIGSRFLGGDGFKSTPLRRIGITILRHLLNNLYGCRLTDPTSGFRLMDRKAMQIFDLEYPYDYPEPISIAICLENKLKVKEIPVQMKARETGDSSIKGLKSLIYMVKVSFQIVMVRLTRIL